MPQDLSYQTTKSLEPGDLQPLSELLARAFTDDPIYQFLMPDAAMRQAQLAWLMGVMVRYGVSYGTSARPVDRLAGVALWMPPGSGDATPWRMLRVGAGAGLWRMGVGNLLRMVKASDFYEKLRKQLMPEPHRYLLLLGIDPPDQGKGIGSTLLAPELAEADRRGEPCYLETSKESNLPFYQRHGFEIVHSGRVPDGGPACWTMRRPPSGNSADQA